MDPVTRRRPPGGRAAFRIAAVVATAAALAAIAQGVPARPPGGGVGPRQAGIEIVGLKLTAAGHMLDLRYRIRDAASAAPLFDRAVGVSLVHTASGARMSVPRTRMGSMRQAGFRPDPGRVYTILFHNDGKVARPGDEVALEAGQLRVDGVRVE